MGHPAFAVGLAEIDGLLDVINWSQLGKWAIPAIALPIIWKAANFFAKKSVQNRLADLENQLKNRGDELEIKTDRINQLEQSIMTQGQTIALQTESLKLKDTQLDAKQEELEAKHAKLVKVYEAGRKEYQKKLELEKFRSLHDNLKKKLIVDEERIAVLEGKLIEAGGETGQLMKDLQARQATMSKAENRLKKARKLEGYLWHAKALQRKPKFRPLLERKTAIISVLNLKGGVGKTTTVAQLGAAFARRGYRVLCVDLDLQGSLTSLLLDQSVISQRYNDKRLLQHFFRYAGDGANPNIIEFTQEVPSPPDRLGSLHVLPTTDDLAFAEFNLNMGWLLQAGERDARFLLRKALHSKAVAKQFDIVIMDCPPLLNISCINALAASDYLLIPALPSVKSLARVLNLMQATQSLPFKTHVNPNLNLLGLLANRTYHSGLTQNDQREWEQLLEQIKNIFAVLLHQFETEIPQLKGIQEGDTITATSKLSGEIEKIYGRLADELEKVLPHDCRRTPPVLP